MKQNEKRRIDGFKFIRTREIPEGRKKWILDFDSKDIGMIVASVMIVAGLIFIGFQFVQVVEKGRSVAGMATQATTTTASTPIVVQQGNQKIQYRYNTQSKQWEYNYPDAWVYRSWYPVSNPSSLEFNNNYNSISTALNGKDQKTGLDYLQTKSKLNEGLSYTGLPAVTPVVTPAVTPAIQTGSQSTGTTGTPNTGNTQFTLYGAVNNDMLSGYQTKYASLTPNLDQGTALRFAKVESNGDPNALSKDNAKGLMQILPPTFNEQVGKLIDNPNTLASVKANIARATNNPNVNSMDSAALKAYASSQSGLINDPELNYMVGSTYYQGLYNTYKAQGKSDSDARVLAIAAYNTGAGNVQKAGGVPADSYWYTKFVNGEITWAEYSAKVGTKYTGDTSLGTFNPYNPSVQPGTTPSTPAPPNAEQQKAIDDMNKKITELGFTELKATPQNIAALQKSLEKAEKTPYVTDIGAVTGAVVVSIDGKYNYIDTNGKAQLIGDKDQKASVYLSKPINEDKSLILRQDVTVTNGVKVGEPVNSVSGTVAGGQGPTEVNLRQDEFDMLNKIDVAKGGSAAFKLNEDGSQSFTLKQGSTELGGFTNSKDLKLDATGKIQAGTITTTNYNYYDKYFDKDGNQITKAEWDKLKPEDRLTPKDNKNTFRSGLTKEENKDGTVYGEGKEEFLTVDKDGTQYRGELTSRVYNQKTSENGVDYGQGDGINFVSDGQGNIMTFNCKFYTGCKFDSVTDINGVKTTDVNSITDPALKKFAQKQIQENSLANRRMFFSDITRSMTQFSGLAGYSSLFMDSETLQAWRESVDRAFATLYLGTDYWSSKICASKIETGSDNLAYVETPDGLIGVAAHIEGEKVDMTNPLNNTQRYIYKIDYFVQNHESSVVSSGFRKNDKKMKFNVEVRGSGGNKEIYSQDIELATGEIKKISKDEMIVKESSHQYDKVCIVFKTPIRTIGSSFATESKDEICNKFSKYTGGPTEVATSSASGGQGGAAEITSDW